MITDRYPIYKPGFKLDVESYVVECYQACIDMQDMDTSAEEMHTMHDNISESVTL